MSRRKQEVADPDGPMTTARHKCLECDGTGVVAHLPDLEDCDVCEGTGEDPEAAR
jgi:DnaJ-class molecular chaperone